MIDKRKRVGYNISNIFIEEDFFACQLRLGALLKER